MWCVECQSDVATEVSSDGQSLLCTTCGNEVRKVFVPGLHPETRSARELLERWAQEQRSRHDSSLPANTVRTLETPLPPPSESASAGEEPAESAAPTAASDPAAEEEPIRYDDPFATDDAPERITPPAAASVNESPLPMAGSGESDVTAATADNGESESASAQEQLESNAPATRYRVDTAHAAPAGPASPQPPPVKRPRHLDPPEPEPVAAGSGSTASPPEPQASTSSESVSPPDEPRDEAGTEGEGRPVRRIDALHGTAPEPHFDVTAIAKKSHPGQAESLWGQLLAYAGVGLLTVGTALVLWGYFGEIERYASTGWLLSTGGQMLLLLGIVTLVAGGMQQTTFEVTERIEHLGGRIIRIEQSTDELLKGPHYGQKSRRREGARSRTDEEADAA
jgi:hypothetical protein